MKSKKMAMACPSGGLEMLLEKYRKELDELLVMDDYDGGKAAQLREIILNIEEHLGYKYD